MLPVADVLSFEARYPATTEAKRAAIGKELGLTGARYFRQLHLLLDNDALLAEALEIDPTTTNRLVRDRERRATARKERS